jgi:hypothetical protein
VEAEAETVAVEEVVEVIELLFQAELKLQY